MVKAVIKSNLGGNLRIRVPNKIKLFDGMELKKAIGENTNTFYQTELTPGPVISKKANPQTPEMKTTFLYDLPTVPGHSYTFVTNEAD